MGIVVAERQVITIDHEPRRGSPQQRQQPPDRRQVFALNLHQCQGMAPGTHFTVDGFDKAGFSHATGPPQQGIVGGQTGGELQGIGQQHITRPVNRQQQRQRDPVDPRHRLQPVRTAVKDQRLGTGKIWQQGRWRADPFQRFGDPAQAVVTHALSPLASPSPLTPLSSSSSNHRPSARSAASRVRSIRRTSRIEIS